MANYFPIILTTPISGSDQTCMRVVCHPLKKQSRKRNAANPVANWRGDVERLHPLSHQSVPVHPRHRPQPDNCFSLRKAVKQLRWLYCSDDLTMSTGLSPGGVALHCFAKRKAKDARCIAIVEERFGDMWMRSPRRYTSYDNKLDGEGRQEERDVASWRILGGFRRTLVSWSAWYSRARRKVSEIFGSARGSLQSADAPGDDRSSRT